MPHTQNSTLYYEVHGSGQPLVLISGLGGDATFWTSSLVTLTRHFQVIIFDNRGIGRSAMPDVPYTIEQMADDIADLLDELRIQTAHILGFSMGGCIAQAFAVRHPHRLQKLIISASYARMGRQSQWFIDAVLSVYETGATGKQMYYLILPWLFSSGYLKRPESDTMLDFDENDPLQQPLHAFRRQYLAQREFDYRAELAQITAPTLVLAGENDALVPLADARELASGIPHSHFFAFPEAGHLFNWEQPRLFHTRVLEFLSERADF